MDVFAALVAVAATLLACAYLAAGFARRAKLRRLIDKLPGPGALPLVGTTHHILGTPRNKLLNKIKELGLQYGPIFRMWLGSTPEVILTKSKHFEAIINSTKHLEKSDFYKFLHPWLGTGLVTSSGQKWHSHRKMLTPAFHLSILDSFIEVFSDNCGILVDQLARRADGSGFDIFPYITRCTLDIICGQWNFFMAETAMGVPVFAQEDADSEYVRMVNDVIELTVYRRERLWLHPDFIFYNTPAGRRYKKSLSITKGFTKKVIQERKNALTGAVKPSQESSDEDRSFGLRKKKAFLDLLLEVSGKEGKLTDEEIREEVDTFMFAGHDTTATSTAWVLFMLGHHPEIQEKVYAEQEEIFQDSKRSPTMKDLQEMKYLDRVIKETLRVYPTVPFIQRVLGEDVRIDGYDIPRGTSVTMSIFLTNLDPESFPDPEQFDPDNFLPERVQGRHHFAFIPFSAGPRNCIGQKFAQLEEKTLLSYILRNFKVLSLDSREDVHPIPEIVLRPEHGIKVCLTSRT